MKINLKNTGHLIIALSVVLFALIISFSAGRFSSNQRYLDMKGLSEKIVKADKAIWPISFDVKANDINYLYKEIETNSSIVKEYLTEIGFEDTEISFNSPNVYQETYREAQFRYNANITLSVFTDKVDLVKENSQSILKLIEKGVVLSGYGQGPSYEISDFNSIKPDMLKEASQKAKSEAKDFAKNSGQKLGALIRANQGVFTITDKDPGSPEYKKVRVVSSFRYRLK